MVKKYVYTSYIPGSSINEDFLRILENYCALNNAELKVVLTAAPNRQDQGLVLSRLIPYVIQSDCKINDNLFFVDLRANASSMDPLSGTDAIANAKGSLVLAAPKHRFKSVARSLKHNKSPRGIWCTGTISEPYYKPNKAGLKADGMHKLGALVITVVNDDIFHIRQLSYGEHGVYDMNALYTKNKRLKVNPEGLVLGDLHPPFVNNDVLKKTQFLMSKLNPKNVVYHDIFDAASISHHVEGKFITKVNVFNFLPSLQEEVSLTARVMSSLVNWLPEAEHFVVKSNHDEHLDRYLDEGRYLKDYQNKKLAIELAEAKLSGKDVVEYSLKKDNPDLEQINFLQRNNTLTIAGIECSNHGDYGANGGKGSSVQHGLSFSGKVVTGHCLSENHSVNVKGKGFIPIREVTLNDYVLSYDYTTKTNEWTKVQEKIYVPQYSGTMVEIGYNGIYKQDVSLNHHFSLLDGSYISLTDLVSTRGAGEIPLVAESKTYNKSIGEIEELIVRLKIAIAADGNIDNTNIRFHLKKPRKIERLKSFLNKLKIPYSENLSKTGSTKILLKKTDSFLSQELYNELKTDKTLNYSLLTANMDVKNIVLHECTLWDGSLLTKGARQFCTSKKHEAEIICSLANEMGYRSSLISKKDGGFVVTFNIARKIPSQLKNYGKDSIKFNVVPRHVENIELFCLKTAYHNFWVRNEETGQVSLTGNSHTPEIGIYGNYICGTMTDLSLPYTNDSGTSGWLNTHTIIYPDGNRTHIHLIDTKK